MPESKQGYLRGRGRHQTAEDAENFGERGPETDVQRGCPGSAAFLLPGFAGSTSVRWPAALMRLLGFSYVMIDFSSAPPWVLGFAFFSDRNRCTTTSAPGCVSQFVAVPSNVLTPFMDQPCYKCAQMVEEGRIFCPHCRAPQIRVIVAEPATVLATTPAQQIELSASETVPVIAVPMSWNQAAQPCVVAALIGALGMVLQLIVPVIAVLGAGFLAVALYRRRNPEIAVHARMGARLGAICGFFCAGMTAILGVVRVAVLHEGDKIRTGLLDIIQRQAVRYTDPQSQAAFEFFRSPNGLLLLLVFMFIFGLITFILLGMLGGTLGGASLGRRDRG